MINSLGGHEGRIGSIAWNSRFMSTGSRDKTILHRDLRTKINFEARLQGHKQEVCGLKWSFDEQQLASGGNDNKLLLWSLHNNLAPQAKFSNHVAAVKAIAWSPHQHGLLASGGGTADRCIRFWNTLTLQPISSLETGS
jgi:cell division cycle 20-like protein 1 (cofactor of APC complex)